jgi:hypothetical protein
MFMPDEPTRVFRESDLPSHPADDRTQMFRRPGPADQHRELRPPEDRYPRPREDRPASTPLPYEDQQPRPALARGHNPPVTPRGSRPPGPAFKAAQSWHWVLTLTWQPPKSRQRTQHTYHGVFRPRPAETRSEAFENIMRDCLKTSGWDGPCTVLFWAMDKDVLD